MVFAGLTPAHPHMQHPLMMRAIAIFVLLIGFTASAAADFDEGLAAYSQGEFATARAAFEPLAKLDPRALFYLGRMYFRGEGVAVDKARGEALFAQAAALGEAAAMSALAAAANARGETAKAFEWTSKAAAAGHPFAQAQLGQAYEAGDGVTQNRQEAIIWYGRAARGGSAIGAARLYRLGADEDKDKHGSLDEVSARLSRAHAGDSEARVALAALFTDVGADAQAFDWYRLAADQGHHEAEYQVGLAFLNGRGVARNDAGALIWIRRAVGGNHAAAMYQLARAFRLGTGGININEGLALEWYENAIEDGYVAATPELVELFIIGAVRAAKDGNNEDARENIASAIAWSERSVTAGDPAMTFAFAQNLDSGFGGVTAEDDRSAVAIYQIAAQQGSLAASNELVRHFSGGDGVDGGDGGRAADIPTAFFWNAILEADDPDNAQGFGQIAAVQRDQLAGSLSKSQIDNIARRVAAWRGQFRR
ncbi:MAG: sel1 repeat family protein [Alphaproteobacteria bacterium]|nr:sel1 repeat family protein [Alphaproteobacteria bacterium]